MSVVQPNAAGGKKVLKKNFWKRLAGKKVSDFDAVDDAVPHIAFIVKGGIGDVVCNLFYIQAFSEKFGLGKFLDIYMEYDADIRDGLLCGKSFFNRALPDKALVVRDYDVIVHLVRLPSVLKFCRDKLQRLGLDELCDYLGYLEQERQQNPIMFMSSSQGDAVAMRYAQLQNRRRPEEADLGNRLLMREKSFALSCVEDSDAVLRKFGLEKGAYILVQRGVGEADRFDGQTTRLWPAARYEEACRFLKDSFPQYRLVQPGSGRDDALTAVHLDLRGKTSFEELKILLKEARLLLCCEGGMAHLRHFLGGGRSVVLFGPTAADFYGYPENVNVCSGACRGCEWLSCDWHKKCLRGFEAPLCFEALNTVDVLRLVVMELR